MISRTPSQNARRSRNKGAAWEREVCALLAECGVDAKRGLSQTRGGGAEEADVVVSGRPELHLECKVGACPNLWGAMEQAADDCKPGQIPIVVAKRDRRPAVVMMPATMWARWLAKMGDDAEHVPPASALRGGFVPVYGCKPAKP